MSPGLEAWHEAGHAFAAHLVGGAVRVVTLEPDADGLDGQTAVEWPAMVERDAAWRSALVALAGPVAELVFEGAELLHDPAVRSTWREDWREADSALARLHADPGAREEARRGLLVTLFRLYDSSDGYECLARIADALDAHETLDEDLFLDALGDVWRRARGSLTAGR